MKICFLGDAKSIHLVRWCEFFRDQGDEVSIITFRNHDIPGVKVIYLGSDMEVNDRGSNFQYIKQIFKIKSILKDIKPDIINAHYLTSYGFLASLVAKRVPLAVSTWGSDILVTPKKNEIYKALTNYVLKKSDLITSDSQVMSEEILKYGVEGNKVITVPMGIDISIFNNEETKRDDKIFKILSFRTLVKNSNIDMIINAYAKFIKKYPHTKLTIANDGSEKENLLNLIKEKRLEENIEFLGSVTREEVVKLLKENHVYVSIPTSDSTSVTLLEAMACGIYPVVSDIPANKEWIVHNHNGLMSDTSEEGLYKALEYVYNNRIIMEEASKINMDIIRQRAVWEDNMNYVRNEYIKLF